jgi:tetratricopeptide (TPR) repeat protein
MRRAQALDPLSRVISLEVGRCLYFMHLYDDAAVQIEQTIHLDQNFAASHVWLGLIYLQQGRLTEAVPELQRESDLTGRVWLGMAGLAVLRARSGDRQAAAALLAEITERARHDYVPPTAFAFVYTGMGQPTDAFRWLDTAVATRDGWLTENFFDPLLDPVRTDPRFAAVEQRMGLDSAHPAPALGGLPSHD